MRKKKLPDHHLSFDDPVIQISTDQIDKLRAKYGFSKSYQLEVALDHVALFHEQKNYYKPPPPVSEQRELFNVIQQSALNMEEAITKLGESELLLIGRQSCGWISDVKIDQISQIRRVAERALTELSERSSSGGRPKKILERSLVAKLDRIYREGTGGKEQFSQNHKSYEFSGKKVEFIEEIVEILGAPVSNQRIGRELKRIRKDLSVKS